jgi:hypothetical protein
VKGQETEETGEERDKKDLWGTEGQRRKEGNKETRRTLRGIE